MKILLADDHPVVMLGTGNVLASKGEHQVVGYASNVSELMEKAKLCSPDLIVTDYSMPGDARYGDGLALIRNLRRDFPDVVVIIYTMIRSPVIVSALYEAGARGVVFKSSDESELLRAVEVTSSGGVYYAEHRHNLAERFLSKDVGTRVDSLSPRELEIVRYFLSGLSVGDIAAVMNRSVKTVSTHKISAMRKLGVSTDHELVMLGLCNDLFD